MTDLQNDESGKKATASQQVILQYVMQGDNVYEIAERLGVKPGTVSKQLYNIRKLLGCRNNVQAALRFMSGMGR